jgi:hypothetical protein
MKSTSKKYSLDWNDLVKGGVLAVLAPVTIELQTWADTLASGVHYELDWKRIAMSAVGGVLAYLFKNFLTDYNSK